MRLSKRLFLLVFVIALWLSAWLRFPLPHQVVHGFYLVAYLVLPTTLVIWVWRKPLWLRLIIGALAVFMLFAAYLAVLLVGPQGWLSVFYALGFIGLGAGCAGVMLKGPRLAYWGMIAMTFCAVLSWGSSAALWARIGTQPGGTAGCILIWTDDTYMQPTSVWETRLPDFLYSETGPGGWPVWNYHALFVAPGADQALYNWSKKRLRFEARNPHINPYAPNDCG